MAADCEALARNRLAITDALDQAVTDDRMFVLACMQTGRVGRVIAEQGGVWWAPLPVGYSSLMFSTLVQRDACATPAPWLITLGTLKDQPMPKVSNDRPPTTYAFAATQPWPLRQGGSLHCRKHHQVRSSRFPSSLPMPPRNARRVNPVFCGREEAHKARRSGRPVKQSLRCLVVTVGTRTHRLWCQSRFLTRKPLSLLRRCSHWPQPQHHLQLGPERP